MNPTTLLITLGTGSICMGNGRSAAGYLLDCGEELYLLDPGPGTLLRMHAAKMDPARVSFVLLSHLHPDHHMDLLGLLFLRKNEAVRERTGELQIFGPPGTRKVIETWYEIYGSWIRDPKVGIHELPLGRSQLGAVDVVASKAKHSKQAYCYRFEFPCGSSFAYSGDSELCEGLIQACLLADYCLVECSFPDDLAVAGHMSPSSVRKLIEEAKPKRVGLTHFYPQMEALLADSASWAKQFVGLDCQVEALVDLQEIVL